MIEAAFKGRLGGFDLDACFAVPASGVTALFGPSGSGKTSILRCLAGLTQLDGRLSVNGEVWQDARTFVAPHRREAGYVFQSATLFPHLSVAGNLAYGEKRAAARRRGAASQPVLDRDAIIDLLGLAPFIDRRPSDLSGGERQRVAIGRALLAAPRLLLMDEPLSALDAMTKADILPYLERLAAVAAMPIVYVSHDIGEVARLADHIVQIAGGRVVGCGSTADMLERLGLEAGVPAFEESALLTGVIASHDTALRLTRVDCGGQSLTVPPLDLPVGQTIRVRVRARDVAIALQRPSGISIRNILDATILTIDAAEDAVHGDVVLGIGDARIKSRITREAMAELALKPGMPAFALIKSVSFDGRRGYTARDPETGADAR